MRTVRLAAQALICKRAPLAVVAASAALILAGCGGSPAPATVTGARSDPSQGTAAAFKFSACMRQHGVTKFPDPVVHSSPGQQSVGIHVTPAETGSPQFKRAQQACQSILPGPSKSDLAAQAQQQRAHKQGLLSFARCLRQHGITSFPDPDAQGNLNPQMLSAAGVDIHAPSVLAAARACIPASQGQVNAAALAQAATSGS